MIRLDKITELHKLAAIHGKLAVVYHGSKTPPEEFIKVWQDSNFRPGSGAGQAVGPGLYTVYNKGGSNTESGGYGSYVYKFVVNLNNYLILVEEEISKVYPELDGLSYKEKLLRQCEKFDINKEIVLDHISEQGFSSGPGAITSVLARKIKDAGLHYGIIYRGKRDGDCCLIQIPEKSKLVAYEMGEKKVRFDKEKLKKINKNYKKLSSNSRSSKEKLLEYAEKYPEKAISIIESKWDSILQKNDSPNTLFYWKAEKRAAENLAKSDFQAFFELDLHEAHPDIGKHTAESLLKKDVKSFFKYKLHESYEDLARPAAEFLLKEDGESFLHRGLHRIYPDLGRSFAEKYIKHYPRHSFSLFSLEKTYPELCKPFAEDLLNKDIIEFFGNKLHYTYPDMAKVGAKNLAESNPKFFLEIGLHEIFPQMGESIIEDYASTKPSSFIHERLYIEYPNALKNALKSLFENEKFATYRLVKILHNLKIDRLDVYNKIPKELIASIIKRLAEEGSSLFFEFSFQKDYPELEIIAAKSLIRKFPREFFKHLKTVKLSRSFPSPDDAKKYLDIYREQPLFRRGPDKIMLWLAENYENLEGFGVKYLFEKDFTEFFDNDYPNKSKEYAELGRAKAAWYLAKDPKSYLRKDYDKLYPEQNKNIKKILFERSFWNLDYGDLIRFSLKLNLDLSNEEILKLIKDMFKDLGDYSGNPKRYYKSISEMGAGGKSEKAFKALKEYPGPLADRFSSELSRQWGLLPEADGPDPDDLPPDYADDNAIEGKISTLVSWLNKNGFKKEASESEDLFEEDLSPTAAAAIILDSKNRVLIAKRGPGAPWMPNKWNLPGGVIDEGEGASEAAMREAREETSIELPFVNHLVDIAHKEEGWSASFFVTKINKENIPVSLDYENVDFNWISRSEISQYDFIPTVREAILLAFDRIYS